MALVHMLVARYTSAHKESKDHPHTVDTVGNLQTFTIR